MASKSSRIRPEIIREKSRRSSTRRAWAEALFRMALTARVRSASSLPAILVAVGPAQKDGVQRGPQLMRHRGGSLISWCDEGFRLLTSLLLAHGRVRGAPPPGAGAPRCHGRSSRHPRCGRKESRTGDTVIDIARRLAILRHTNGLEVVDALTPPDLREDLVFLRPSLGRNDQGDVLTDRLLGHPGRTASRPPGSTC